VTVVEREWRWRGTCCGILGPRPKLLGFIGQVQPLIPIHQIKRQVMVEVREKRFNWRGMVTPLEEAR
jgi:hypothetical protein